MPRCSSQCGLNCNLCTAPSRTAGIRIVIQFDSECRTFRGKGFLKRATRWKIVLK
jgi:hypothetical protein